MKRISILLALVVAGFPASAYPAEKPSAIRDVLSRFVQSDWQTVRRAKWEPSREGLVVELQDEPGAQGLVAATAAAGIGTGWLLRSTWT
jgi:hypothetical protein